MASSKNLLYCTRVSTIKLVHTRDCRFHDCAQVDPNCIWSKSQVRHSNSQPIRYTTRFYRVLQNPISPIATVSPSIEGDSVTLLASLELSIMCSSARSIKSVSSTSVGGGNFSRYSFDTRTCASSAPRPEGEGATNPSLISGCYRQQTIQLFSDIYRQHQYKCQDR